MYEAKQLLPVPQGTPLDVGAISACSGLTAYNAVMSLRSALDEAVKVTGKAGIYFNSFFIYLAFLCIIPVKIILGIFIIAIDIALLLHYL